MLHGVQGASHEVIDPHVKTFTGRLQGYPDWPELEDLEQCAACVVLMLFLVGLELEPERLWELRRPIFGWGSAQVLMCAALITGVAMAFGVNWQISLVAGLGLALSSTAIALQAIGERNLMPTSSGQAGFSILLFQDVAAIPILALLPLLGTLAGENETLAQSNRA